MAEHAFILTTRDKMNKLVVECAYCHLVATTVEERFSHEECEVHTRSITEGVQSILLEQATVKACKVPLKDQTTQYEQTLADENIIVELNEKTLEDSRVAELKNEWLKDPCWDIETTKGFEGYSEELLKFRLETEIRWKESEEERKVKKALQLRCSIQMVEYLERLETRIEECEKLINRITY